MSMRKPLSVQQKMTGIIFLVSIFVMLLTSAQFIFFELRRIHAFAEEDAHSLSHVISTNAGMPMALKDHHAMQLILDSLNARKNVASAYLLSPSGQSIVSYSSAEVSARQNAEEQVASLQLESQQINEGRQLGSDVIWEEKGRIAHFMPVSFEGNLVGYSFLSFETGALAQQKLFLVLGWLLAMGAAIVATYFLSAWLQKHITGPVEKLSSRMKQITIEKRLVGPERHESRDEFSLLFDGFDEMIKALRERDQLLEQHRRDLELEVKVRTRALEAEKEKAEQATLAKSKFLANMSHEIRTPMIGVLGMAELLRTSELSPKDHQLVETIYRSGEALLSILNDVLDFSKIEAGRLEVVTAPVDVRQLAYEVVQLMAINAKAKGLVLNAEMPDVMPVLIGDPGRIRQILLNLVGNAVKFTDRGSVSVSMLATLDETADVCNCLFVVKDTGPGIPVADQERIFNSFDQGAGSSTRLYGGTGLGLSIVRDLVHAMDGVVSLESTPGQGSSFTVCLPLPLASQDVQPPVTAGAGLAAVAGAEDLIQEPLDLSGRDIKILLAEDNPTTQALISILVEQMGYDLTVVDNGQAAVDYLEKEQVDLILMDCQMPQLDGYKATSQLRANGLKTPIIALTAYARAEDEEECLAAGMSDFLSKPFRQFEMHAILKKWLPAHCGPGPQSTGKPAV